MYSLVRSSVPKRGLLVTMFQRRNRWLAVFLLAICTPLLGLAEEAELVFDNGDRYIGESENGQPHGSGRLERADGRTYTGEFREGEIIGSASLTTKDGYSYYGTFLNDLRHGLGTSTWPNDNRYEGSFQNDEIWGQGKFTWGTTGDVYEGSFSSGLKHGYGTYTWADGRRYQGGFRDDMRHGLGIIVLSDNSEYRGFFSNDQKHGLGVLRTSEDELLFQRWNRDKLITSESIQLVEHCQLVIEDKSWMFQSDSCVNGLAHGNGTAVREDGAVYIDNGWFVLGRIARGVPIVLDESSE